MSVHTVLADRLWLVRELLIEVLMLVHTVLFEVLMPVHKGLADKLCVGIYSRAGRGFDVGT